MARWILLLAMLCTLVGVATDASAQAYRWQDEDGQVHFTDDPSDIPPRYRKQTEQLELPDPAPRSDDGARADRSSGAGEGIWAEAVTEAVRTRWPDVAVEKRRRIAATIMDRLFQLILALIVHSAATLLMFVHAVASRRPFWAAGNLLLLFVPPIYALCKVDTGAFNKMLVIVGWATGPAVGFGLQWAIAQIVA